MRTVKLGTLLTIGLLAMPAAAFADPGSAPPPPPGSTSVFSQMLGRKSSATITQTDAARPNRPTTKPKPTTDPSIKARDQELANWLRRAAVCTKLLEIADETGDESLRKKAEELDRRARATYERRMGELGGEIESDRLEDFDRDRRGGGTRSAGVLRSGRQTEGGSE
jgi:hypothetical protein